MLILKVFLLLLFPLGMLCIVDGVPFNLGATLFHLFRNTLNDFIWYVIQSFGHFLLINVNEYILEYNIFFSFCNLLPFILCHFLDAILAAVFVFRFLYAPQQKLMIRLSGLKTTTIPSVLFEANKT